MVNGDTAKLVKCIGMTWRAAATWLGCLDNASEPLFHFPGQWMIGNCHGSVLSLIFCTQGLLRLDH